ncbi:hypothetical protein L6452_36070 [Arctium lappa]|uniref:Uncharacterized protein n=1 Tax=Arctium lappa TaxID=4217 RepID=A0ACB8Y8W5_ARCLA|nr:hypothetical protein L6452_36070 [Arctium lappa]
MDKGIKRGSISGAIIPALMHRIPSELRNRTFLVAGGRAVLFFYFVSVGRAFVLLFVPFFFVHGAERGESQDQAAPVSARRGWERSGRRMDKGIKRGSISGAIIPALMHRIPSELRS